MAGKIYELHLKDGTDIFIDVDEINYFKAYDRDFISGGIQMSMKNGKEHSISGSYEHLLPKKPTTIYKEIVNLRKSGLNEEVT